MPTLAQLRAEPWWNAEVVTPELEWLVSNLCTFFGVPRINGGAKGDEEHLDGGHRSQIWILNSRYCTNRTYTVEPGLPASLVNCIGAFDITLSDAGMKTISRNADAATRSGQLEELVEWFGNLFNDSGKQKVDGYNNIKNATASSDSSHLWHFHGRPKRALLRDMGAMRKIYAALTGQKEDTMAGFGFRTQDDADAASWRLDALANSAESVRGGPVKGEKMGIVIDVHKLQDDVKTLQAGGVSQEMLNAAVLAALQDPAVLAALKPVIHKEAFDAAQEAEKA